MIKNETLGTLKEDLANARKYVEYAKTHAPNFGQSLVSSLKGISHVIEGIPISLIDDVDYLVLNSDFVRLRKKLSQQGLEKEAALAGDILTKLTAHRYV
jgi:hypothetical protein